MGLQERVEGKGISSFTISQNGNVTLKKNYGKKQISISVLAVIGLFLIAIFVYYSYTEAELTVCKTKECLQSAVSLMNCINETVDPCDDFYEYACGMFQTNYPSYCGTDENSWITILSLRVKQKVKKFLNQENTEYEPEAVHKTRMFYKSCLNFLKDQAPNDYDPLWDAWKKVGLDTNYLNDSTPLEIETVLAKIKTNFNMDIFFGIGVDDDPRNSSSHSLLIIDQNGESNKFKKTNSVKKNKFTIEEDSTKFTEYFKLIIDRLLNLNQIHVKKIGTDDLMNTTKELNDFESEILKISKNANFFKNDIPEIFTLGELQNLTDFMAGNFHFNWTLYLREVFRETEPLVYEQLTSENSDEYEILITNRDYLDDLFMLLSKTPTTIIKMSILTHVVAILENNFPSAEHINYDYCFSLTTELFGMVTGYTMINTLDNSSKAALTEMFDNIKWALKKMVNEVSWMDDETKNATLRKLANTKTYFGYPNNYNGILNHLFQNLSVTENHVENIISASIFNAKSHWKYLIHENNRDNMAWEVTPDEVNAYNHNSLNAFYMPAAILQAPLYYNGVQSLNYGATGSTIGHELSHNYDNTGRLYNELGNVVPWWTNRSYEEYSKRVDCLISYYNGIKVTSHNKTFEINGVLTLDENIADIAGLKEAYFAYQRYVDKHGQEPRLTGMEQYSQEQLFFLGYANQYCHYDMSDGQFGNSNNHSPNMVRVRGALSLLPEFAKAWSCPLGTPMNPETKKCQIW